MDRDTGVDAGAIEDRATLDRYEPPVYGLDEPLWIAEDPETECQGLGRVRAEARGNLVAVVADHDDDTPPRVKLPGSTIPRVDAETGDADDAGGLLDSLRKLL